MSNRKGSLTAAAVINIIGTAQFDKLMALNVECTNRVMDNGETEWVASIPHEGDTVSVYYYQDADAISTEDLSDLDWYANGFEIY